MDVPPFFGEMSRAKDKEVSQAKVEESNQLPTDQKIVHPQEGY
jgi:hypothetical protein